MPRMTPPGLRVLITTDSVGGVWRYVMDLSGELAQRGAQVAVACLGPAPSVAQSDEASVTGVALFRLDGVLDWTADGADAVRASARELDALVDRWSPTVLHLNTPAIASFLKTATPRVVVAHSCVATWWAAVRRGPLPSSWRWYVETTKAGLASADIAVAPTAAFARALSAIYGPLPQLHVIGNGSAPMRPVTKERFAFAAGRWWDEAKNAAALDAAAAIATCPIYAAGPLRGPTGGTMRFRNVRWLGELSYPEIRSWHERAAIFVSPAIYEPFGLAALEAANAGAALVLSAIPTFRELWDGCATFVPADDPAALGAEIDRIANDPIARERLTRAAQRRACDRTIPRQVNALIGAYGAAVSAHSRAA